MRRIVTLMIVLALGATLSACGSSSPPSSSTSTSSSPPSSTSTSSPPSVSPRAQLAAMRSAARSKHSVHTVSISTAPGHTISIVCDAGTNEGSQRIIVTDHGKTGSLMVIVTAGTAYVRGDALTLHLYYGFSSGQSTRYAGKWISVPDSNAAYATVSAGVTFASFLSQLFQPMTTPSIVTAGRLIGVHGTVHGQAGPSAMTTLFAPAHGEPLPVKQTAKSSGKGGTGVVTMSKWNEPVQVSAPANAVPITTVLSKF